MGKKTLCQLRCGGTNYYLLTELRGEGQDGFDLTLSNGYSGWTGKVTKAALSSLSKGVKMKLDEYVAETRKALTCKDVGNLHFQYQVKLGGDTATLVWKKHVPADNIKFQLGQAILDESPEPAEVINSIFEQAIETTSRLQSVISSLEADNQRLATERASALKRLEKCVSAKEDLEKDLYTKFAIVVNDKKAKIRDLKEQIEDLKQDGPSTSNSKPQASTSQARPASSGSEEEAEDDGDRATHLNSDYDTDEEKEEAPPAKKSKGGRKTVRMSPETGDTSLLLDMEDDTEDIQPSARRQRRGKGGKKTATPSKPVLPRGGSGNRDSSASTPGRTPLGRKGSRMSSASNRSSDDVEQLLDEL